MQPGSPNKLVILETLDQSRVGDVSRWRIAPIPRLLSLTTAEILYRLPDFPRLLESYIWQDYDVAPNFPKLVDFLGYWAAQS